MRLSSAGWVAGFTVTAIAACMPSFEDLGSFACADNGKCPARFECIEKHCVKQDITKDASLPSDSATSPATASIILSRNHGLVTSEAGGTTTFGIYLGKKPSSSVTLALTATPKTEISVAPELTVFSPGNWETPQTVEVKGVDDTKTDADQEFSIEVKVLETDDPEYKDLAPQTVTGTNVDNDVAAITVTPTTPIAVFEKGTPTTLTVTLAVQPSDTVTLAVTSSVLGAAIVAPTSLIFTPTKWDAQTITVTGVDDTIVNTEDKKFIVKIDPAGSKDKGYASLAAIERNGTCIDDDAAGLAFTPSSGLSVSESGTKDTVIVQLRTPPNSTVTIPVTSSKPSEAAVSPTSLTFTPTLWSVPQTVTVTGVDDFLVDGASSWSVQFGPITSTDPKYSGMTPPSVSGTTADNDTASIVVTAPSSPTTTESGGAATFTVKLNAQPTQSVTIGLASSNTAEGIVSPSQLVFTSSNWSMPQTVTVTGVYDGLVDGNKSYAVTFSPSQSTDTIFNGLTSSSLSVTSVDVAAVGRVSVDATGVEGNGHSAGYSPVSMLTLGAPRISSDGRYVAFASDATNLIGNDNNGAADVFIHDRQLRSTTLVSESPTAVRSNLASYAPLLSADGRYVAFYSLGTDLVPSAPHPGCYLRDLQANTIVQVSSNSACSLQTITLKGQVAWTEGTTLRAYDTVTASAATFFTANALLDVSASDYFWITYRTTSALVASDTNGVSDLYLVNLDVSTGGTPTRVSLTSSGGQLTNGVTHGAYSPDGSYFTFTTKDALTADDTNSGADVYLVNRTGGASSIVRASKTNLTGEAGMSHISKDGSYVAFEFTPTGQSTQVWVYDRKTALATSLFKTYMGSTPDGDMLLPFISGDGAWIAVHGKATNLVPNDKNAKYDVFVLPRP